MTMNIKSPTRNRSGLAARGLVLIISAAALFANAQSTNDSDSTATDYSTFQVIVQRNIFNPDRYPQYNYSPGKSRRTPTFSLAGTMSYRKGMFAFFDGTSDEYRKALQVGGTIAGSYTVTKIDFDGVELQGAGKKIEMKVGAAMRQEGDGWELSAPGQWEESSSSETEIQDTNAPAATSPLPGGAGSDVLKRLMERRAQELK